MNTTDAVVLAIVLVGALSGFRGAIRQLVNAAAWVASLIAPYYWAAPAGHLIANRFDAPYVVGYVVAATLIAIVAQLVVRIVVAIIGRILRSVYDRVTTVGDTDKEKNAEAAAPIRGSIPDRLLGALVGATKWAMVVWVVLSGIALVAKPLKGRGVEVSLDGAETYKFSQHHNAFRVIWGRDYEHLTAALKRLSTLKAWASVHGDLAKTYKDLARDERVKSVLSDSGMQKALANNDFETVMASPQILSLLTDPTAMEQATRIAKAKEAGDDLPESAAGKP